MKPTKLGYWKSGSCVKTVRSESLNFAYYHPSVVVFVISDKGESPGSSVG